MFHCEETKKEGTIGRMNDSSTIWNQTFSDAGKVIESLGAVPSRNMGCSSIWNQTFGDAGKVINS